MSLPVVLGDGPLRIEDVVMVARHGAKLGISDVAAAAIDRSRAHVERLASSGEPVYGVSTGFGALATRYIEPAKRHLLQRSLVRSHAAGTGPAVETEVVRALMTLRVATLCTGRTGVRLSTVRAATVCCGATPRRRNGSAATPPATRFRSR